MNTMDIDIIKTNRYISQKTKTIVLDRQQYKCANNAHYPSINLSDYSCLLWRYQDGTFDQSGYEFDHIDEYSITNNNTLENIQALCPMCHSVKTKKFKNNRNFFTSTELANGAGMMEVDKVVKKKRKN